MDRSPGLSVRLKLTLSYAGFLMVAGIGLVAVVWVFLLRYVPDHAVVVRRSDLGPRWRDGADALSRPSLFIPGRSDLWDAFAPKAALMLALLLLFGLFGGWLLAGRMLAPLDRITDATRAAGRGALSHRIRLRGRRDEFRELADAFDGMMARIEGYVDEQQRFAGNASHELRTPLAITRTLLDVARKDPDRDIDELLDHLQTVNTRAIDLTEALLLLSRAGDDSFAREPLDLSLAVEEAIETLLPLAESHHVAIDTFADTAMTVGSPSLLRQMTTNLLHNAIVHNLSTDGSVWVTTTTHPRGVSLTVENTGEQLTPHVVSTLTEPFQRGTQRIRTDGAGVGLGLAIVDRIAGAHHGTLRLDARQDGGLEATVNLPGDPSV